MLAHGPLRIDGERVVATRSLIGFYEGRLDQPVWIGPGSRARVDRLRALVEVLGEASAHGLSDEAYHRSYLVPLSERETLPLSAGAAADLELVASDAFVLFATHLANGRVRPSTFEPSWLPSKNPYDPLPLLAAIDAGSKIESLRELAPGAAGYRRLLRAREAAVALIRRVEADTRSETSRGEEPWPSLAGAKLEVGSVDDRVPELRRRLVWLEEAFAGTERDRPLSPPTAAGPEPSPSLDPAAAERTIDPALERAIRAFQSRHGLEPDGVLGPRSFAVLDRTPAQRLEQIDLNLERWRWLPEDLGARHVMVNLPGFDLRLVEGGETTLHKRVVVGRAGRETPVMSDLIRYLVLNPSWNVPPSLAVRDKLPLLRKDASFATREGFVISRGDVVVDAASVDWSQVAAQGFPYRLRQKPGVHNALGQVKFMFPNPHNIYLHDTPTRELFDRAARDFSSGCIRVEHPLELAAALLGDEWSLEAIEAALEPGRERTVTLPEPVPVHLQHWSVWVDEESGAAQFRGDLYGRDARLAAALAAARPK